jgi:hypothetical protein
MIGPPERTWVGVGTKLLETLYPGGTKRLGPPDGFSGSFEEVVP